jgi:hypothetical protein
MWQYELADAANASSSFVAVSPSDGTVLGSGGDRRERTQVAM